MNHYESIQQRAKEAAEKFREFMKLSMRWDEGSQADAYFKQLFSEAICESLAESERLKKQVENLKDANSQIGKHSNAIMDERDKLTSQRAEDAAAHAEEVERLTKERDEAREIARDRDARVEQSLDWGKAVVALRAERDSLRAEVERLTKRIAQLEDSMNTHDIPSANHTSEPEAGPTPETDAYGDQPFDIQDETSIMQGMEGWEELAQKLERQRDEARAVVAEQAKYLALYEATDGMVSKDPEGLKELRAQHDSDAKEIAELKRKLAESDDFMVYMTSALSEWECKCGKSAASTPPMMWPELIGCIVAKQVESATARADAAEAACAALREALQGCINSATPNIRDNPHMSRAWEVARTALALARPFITKGETKA